MTNADAQYAALWPRGPRQAKVKPLAKRLLAQFGSLSALLCADAEAIGRNGGIGEGAVAEGRPNGRSPNRSRPSVLFAFE